MKLQDIILKNGASTPANVTFYVASQEGTTSVFTNATNGVVSDIRYNFRRATAKDAGRANTTLRVTVPAVISNGQIVTPAREALVRIETIIAPSFSDAERKDILAYAAGTLSEPMFQDAVIRNLLPY